MSKPKQATVVRHYEAAPDDCTQAVSLLLQASFNSQTRKGGPHDLTQNRTTEIAKNGPRIKVWERT